MSVNWLPVIAGVSSFLGLLSLLAYWFTALKVSSLRRSVKETVEGDPLISSDQVLNVLGSFHADTARLDALAKLLSNDRAKARAILEKVKDDVDIENFEAGARTDHLKAYAVGGIFFFLLGCLGLAYSFTRPMEEIVRLAVPQTTRPSGGEVFTHYPRMISLAWLPVDSARGYEISVEVQDPNDGSWHPHPGGPTLKHVRGTELEVTFVGSQPGRWRVRSVGQRIAELENSPWSPWSYFEFADAALEAYGMCLPPCWTKGPTETIEEIMRNPAVAENISGANIAAWALQTKGSPVRESGGNWRVPLIAMGEMSDDFTIELITDDAAAQTLQQGSVLFITGSVSHAGVRSILIKGWFGAGIALDSCNGINCDRPDDWPT